MLSASAIVPGTLALQRCVDRIVQCRRRALRIRATYRHYHGRAPNLLRPRRFTEKMQWRKLFDLDPRYAALSDKVAVRDFIAARLGDAYLIPLLWVGDDPDTIPFDELTPPFVLKSTHATGHSMIVKAGDDVDRNHVCQEANRWLSFCLGTYMDEPGYVHVPRRLMVERQLLTSDGRPPLEHKFFVFHGKVAVILSTLIGEYRVRYGVYHTPDWQPSPWPSHRPIAGGPLARPARLDDMLDAATRLAAGFDHLRIDMYDGEEGISIGEITVYSYSGFRKFSDDMDNELGELWRIPHPVCRGLATAIFRDWRILPPL